MFGLSFDAEGVTNPVGTKSLIQLVAIMRSVQVCVLPSVACRLLTCPLQILYLGFGLFIFAVVSTILARRRPHGPQPAAYGHLQTLANLVDEWSPTMWWGHKTNGKPIHHAGKSIQILYSNSDNSRLCMQERVTGRYHLSE
jgi:hypothetical protein